MKTLARVVLAFLVLSAVTSNATNSHPHSSFGGPIPLCDIDPTLCPDTVNSSLQAMK